MITDKFLPIIEFMLFKVIIGTVTLLRLMHNQPCKITWVYCHLNLHVQYNMKVNGKLTQVN